MTISKMPYFLTNEKFYNYDDNNGVYILSEAGQADEEAKKSFIDFYNELDEFEED